MGTSIIDFDKVDPRFINADFPTFPEYVFGDLAGSCRGTRSTLRRNADVRRCLPAHPVEPMG